MRERKHVALLHAYSRRNSGDGLLVDLSVKMLREALGEHIDVTIVAADPASFADCGAVLGAPVIAERGAARVAAAVGMLSPVQTRKAQRFARLLESADLIVGVGGGYLRARNAIEALKLEVGHMLQMRAARASAKPTVYLPQSIGPACAGIGIVSKLFSEHLIGLLSGMTSVFVRDDRSFDFLAGNGNTQRAPDLAVLELGERRGMLADAAAHNRQAIRHVAVVLREAPSWTAEQCERYRLATRRLLALLEKRCRVSLAVQSTGRGNDDGSYYRRIGVTHELRSLRSLLAEDRPDIVVSVRLHGALEAILAGVPAYHLSYERKGFGAYDDLGIPDWVVNAADFDAGAVIERIFAPLSIPRFWDAALCRADTMRVHRSRVIQALRSAVDLPLPLHQKGEL